MSERIRTRADLLRAVDHLKRADSTLAQVITEQTSYRVYRKRSSFESLVRIVVGQQLSTQAAGTIYQRVLASLEGRAVTPESVMATQDDVLLSAGVSKQKLSTIRSISSSILKGALNLRSLSRHSDERVAETLVRIKGIGPWSAQMYQMFVIRSSDVFPESDTGIQNAIRRLYGVAGRHPSKIALKWIPYRTVACWYLWRYLDSA